MNLACELCRGACCECMVLDPVAMGFEKSAVGWFRYHGEPTPMGTMIEVPCRYLQNGLCAIYETRPATCRDFAVGCAMCRAVVRARRQKQYRDILDKCSL